VNSSLKWKFFFYVVLPLVTVVFFMSPLRGNVCISQFRLSDEKEQIEAALDYYVPSLSAKIDFEYDDPETLNKDYKTHLIEPRFTTKEDFKLRFPDCCSVTTVFKSVGTIWDWEAWLTGKTVAFVNVVFEVGYVNENSTAAIVHHYEQIPVSSCDAIEADVFTNGIGRVAKYPFGSPSQGMMD
jgi:hypothetical protein